MARNKYPEETKKRIVDAAAKLFMEKGYDHTSIQDIINELGNLSKGAIYHHFKSKEEIMYAVFERMYTGSTEEMVKVCRRKDLNGREKLKEVFRISLFHPSQQTAFAMGPDMLKNPQLLVLFIKDSVQNSAPDMIQEILEEGVADGSIQAEHTRQLAEVLILIANMWLNPMVYKCDPEEMLERTKFYSHLMGALGLDIVEDEWIKRLEELTRLYQESREEEPQEK